MRSIVYLIGVVLGIAPDVFPQITAEIVSSSTVPKRDLRNSGRLQAELSIDSPVVTHVTPLPGEVNELSQITVTFSKPVEGVTAEDFLINNRKATSMTGSGATYVFNFEQPDYGVIEISWEDGHDIIDLSNPSSGFDGTAPTSQWFYVLREANSPNISSINPPPGTTVRALSQIELQWSEPVIGFDKTDLMINGSGITNVQALSGNRFLLQFPPIPSGPAAISWKVDHGIVDLGRPPSSFTTQPWVYHVDPKVVTPNVIITEFLAAQEDSSALKDEDGEPQDWIEIHNPSPETVNLLGWSLTDDPDEPGLWTFPNTTLVPGQRLVVFASGKDRITNPGMLHTNFKLSTDGEYLGLFNAESPRKAVTEFPSDFPEQRNDFSYGVDTGGLWRYFQTPTPGQPNGGSSIVGVLGPVESSNSRGFYDDPFELTLSHSMPGAVIRYTIDGSPPTLTGGQTYQKPLQISKTTILRAAAFSPNLLPSKARTDSFIFLDQVITQPNDPPGFPVGPEVMSGYPSDYEMDPEIVNHPDYRPLMRQALQAIPTMSIVMKMEDIFGEEDGIYTHPLNRGPLWERPCSVEFMPLDGKGFQVDAGIQIQGNGAREPIRTPKHPMRLLFKGDYGPTTLSYQMFEDSPVEEFDTLILRADYNFSWLHWNPEQRIRGQRTRDAWMKDTMRSMGGLAGHNRYVHLYINGVYWGIYDPAERPDGSFGAAYLGGEKEDYDVINEGEVVDGTGTAYDDLLAFSDLEDPSEYEAIKQYLDLTQFIDYMLLHFFVGHEDWSFNWNWYAIRPKDGSGGFKYIPWDGENILGELTVRKVNQSSLPSGLHPKLVANEEYRLAFADRVHKHFFNNGALTPSQNQDRWMNRARQVELPIIAESARWGDYRRDVHQYSSGPYELFTRNDQWRDEQTRLMESYFPNRTELVLEQLNRAGLYPSLEAPSLNQFGGRINSRFELTMSAPEGTIYYTTDGTDPRTYGTGDISRSAEIYEGALTLNSSTLIKARTRQGTTWSALTEASFSTEPLLPAVRITELMYHPTDGDEFEFIELQNLGGIPIDLSGWYLTGIDYIFPPNTSLAPGGFLLLVSNENPAAFAQRFPATPVFGFFAGQLVNRGEKLALLNPAGQTITSVDYDDANGWPEQADGDGYSLEILNPLGDPDDPANWHRSVQLNGSPALSNPSQPESLVRFNEISSAGPGPDFVELHNSSSQPVTLSGWRLTDAGNEGTYFLPAGTVLQPDAYLVIYCDRQTNSPGLHAPFGIDAESETILLLDSVGSRADAKTTGPLPRGFSLGQVSGEWVLNNPTPGTANVAAELGSPSKLFFNEWVANSSVGEPDWLELFNVDSKPVALTGLFFGVTNRLFEITSPAFIAPGGFARLYADEAGGPNHLDFKLPAEGATLTIQSPDGITLESTTYSTAPDGFSQGRYPDGTDNIIDFSSPPTPARSNSLAFPIEISSTPEALELSWPAVPGRTYRLEQTSTLVPPAWTLLQEITATNSTPLLAQPLGQNQNYYRVIALP